MTQTEWSRATIDRVAAGIRDARGHRSAQWLSDRTEELGHPISRVAISNLEVGRKSGLDIADFLILARALEVPPIALLFPGLIDSPVEVVPGQHVVAADAFRWFTAEGPPNPGVRAAEWAALDGVELPADEEAKDSENSRVAEASLGIRLMRQWYDLHRELEQTLSKIGHPAARAQSSKSMELRKVRVERAEDVHRAIVRLEDEMRAAGLLLPGDGEDE